MTKGQTLRDIAQAVWGDASLWYLIAEANGLVGNEAPTAGMTLWIPNKVTNINNNASTFRVYNAGEAIGNTSPTLSDVPPPSKKCGGLGMLIAVVVAVVATIATAGAAAVALGATTGVMSAGVTALGAGLAGGLGVGAGLATTVATFAAAGAAGAIASQAVLIAAGEQESFSWKSVAQGALGSVVGGSLTSLQVGNAFTTTVARAAVGNIITQGVAVATGLQSSFSWRTVAASAVGAGVGYGIAQAIGQAQYGEQAWEKMNGVTTSSAAAYAKAAVDNPWGTAFRSLASGLMAGAASSIVQGGRVNWNSVIQTAVGSTIGEAIQAEARLQAARANEVSKAVSQAWERGIKQLDLGGEGFKLRAPGLLNANSVSPASTLPNADQTLQSIRDTVQNWPRYEPIAVLAANDTGTVSDAGSGIGVANPRRYLPGRAFANSGREDQLANNLKSLADNPLDDLKGVIKSQVLMPLQSWIRSSAVSMAMSPERVAAEGMGVIPQGQSEQLAQLGANLSVPGASYSNRAQQVAGDLADAASLLIAGYGLAKLTYRLPSMFARTEAGAVAGLAELGGASSASFASEAKLASHFKKHGVEFKVKSVDDYLQVGRDVMQQGHRVEYTYMGETRTGYVQFMGNTRSGEAKFAFVGTNTEGAITTIHVERARDLFKLLNGNRADTTIKVK